MSTSAHTREELAKVASLVLTARRLLASGTLVDLSAIEERVRTLCAAVDAMPREDGQQLIDEIVGLINKLDRLDLDLREQLGQLADRLDGHGGES